MPSLCFVQPAYLRYELSAICLAQRRWLCDELIAGGIDANCVVITDDYNGRLAKTYGFPVVSRDNQWLGRRFNDGYEWAAQNGYDYVFAIGSDMWALPQMWLGLKPILDTKPDHWYMHRYYCLFHPTGLRRLDIKLTDRLGVLRTMPTETLAQRNYRPCKDNLARGCDTSTWHYSKPSKIVECFHSKFELVGFQSNTVQVSDYQRLKKLWAEVEIITDPFDDLYDTAYPDTLIDLVKGYYLGGAHGDGPGPSVDAAPIEI